MKHNQEKAYFGAEIQCQKHSKSDPWSKIEFFYGTKMVPRTANIEKKRRDFKMWQKKLKL